MHSAAVEISEKGIKKWKMSKKSLWSYASERFIIVRIKAFINLMLSLHGVIYFLLSSIILLLYSIELKRHL